MTAIEHDHAYADRLERRDGSFYCGRCGRVFPAPVTDSTTLVREARDHIEHIAQGVPGAMADRIRRGENEDPRTSLIVRLANEVERLSAQLAAVRQVASRMAAGSEESYYLDLEEALDA